MALIKTVAPQEAEGIIKEGYDMWMKNLGMIPKPMEMISVSPGLFEIAFKRVQYMASHPRLSFSLLAHIRYLVSRHLDYPFCTDFNKHILVKQGYEEDDLTKIEEDPAKSLLDDNENAMLAFVIKSIKSPGSITEADIEELKDQGWQDSDMVDALSQGVSMHDHAIMMQVFQMDQNCMAE